MEKYRLDHDIKVLCVSAKSFPDGIMEAFDKLHSLLPVSAKRQFFGISRPNENGVIGYKAAAEELVQGEAGKAIHELFVIQGGEYISLVINDYLNDIPAIGNAFHQLIAHPDIDPYGYCVEWYFNEKDVRCMVKLKT